MFGARSDEDLIARDIRETWVREEDLDYAFSYFQKGDPLINFEAERKRLDGSKWWVLMNTQPIHFEGKDAGIVWHVDITEKIVFDAALRESEAAFRDFTEVSSDWFWEMDSHLRYSFISRHFEDFIEVPKENLLGKTRAESGISDVSSDVWVKHLADLNAHRPFRNFEHQRTNKNGDVVWTSVSGKPIFDNDGAFQGYRGTATDITESKRLEGQLRQSQRMEAVGQLTGGIAHDFNNLLAVMIGNAELLLLRDINKDKLRHHLKQIIKAVNRAASLTDRLLAFSRQQTLSPVSSDITKYIDGLEDLLRRTLGETIDYSFVHVPKLWKAIIDPHQFENALVNLTLNARDAMPEGGMLTVKTANVTLDKTYAEQHEEVHPGEYVEVAVTDTGTGMAPDVLEKAFEPFFTTKEVGKGSGLGLSMVFGFAKQSNGHVTVDSQLGEGTTVKLYLPRSADAETNADAPGDAQIASSGSERILVVEDDEGVRNISVSILSEHGYDVVAAIAGNDAIEKLKTDPLFDLLFTDVILPGGMSGVDIAKQAKTLNPNIKVIYTTGYAENSIVYDEKRDQAISMLNKPYRRSELLEKVRLVLDEHMT